MGGHHVGNHANRTGPQHWLTASSTTSFMEDTQEAKHQQEQQRHAEIELADFVVHVSSFQRIIDMCNTSHLGTVTKAYMKNIMDWGVCIEEVSNEPHR